MRIPTAILRRKDGQWSLRHENPEIGSVEGTTPTRNQEKLRGKIRCRLEVFPSSSESYRHIEIEIFES